MQDSMDTVITTAEVPAQPVEVSAPEVKTPEPPKADPLAKIIAEQRANRARVEAESKAKADIQAENGKLREQLDAVRKASSFEDDPVAYAKSRKWDKYTQAFLAQTLLYDLVPDKAPQDIRLRLYEMRQSREKAEAEATAKQKEMAAQAEAQQVPLRNYAMHLEHAMKTEGTDAFPESASWFDGDDESYHSSLMATAKNMAESAKNSGTMADLSYASVAKTLETEVSRRFTIRDTKLAARRKTQADKGTGPKTDKAGSIETADTKGMGGSVPAKPATTDAERIARAAAVAFKTK